MGDRLQGLTARDGDRGAQLSLRSKQHKDFSSLHVAFPNNLNAHPVASGNVNWHRLGESPEVEYSNSLNRPEAHNGAEGLEAGERLSLPRIKRNQSFRSSHSWNLS